MFGRWWILLAISLLGTVLGSPATSPPLRRQSVVNRYGLSESTAVTTAVSGISIGFHIDWNAGEKPTSAVTDILAKPAAIIGGYVHLNLTNQTYWEMADQVPVILENAQTTIYSVAVIPEFSLALWESNMTTTLAEQMANLNAQGITVWLRFAYEQNGDWMRYGRDPSNFVRVWTEVALAVRASAPRTFMLWSPNSYPGDAYGLSGYVPYYPGPAFVDIAGLSLYNLGKGQVENDLISPTFLTEYLQSFYDLYGASHSIVISETSAPEHYSVPPQYSLLGNDDEVPGGGNAVDWATAVRSNGTAPDELTRKSAWFDELTSATTASTYPNLIAVMWFNLAKVGGYQRELRLNDWRIIKSPDDPVTAYVRSQVGDETAYQASKAATSTASQSRAATATANPAASPTSLITSGASHAERYGMAATLGAVLLNFLL